MSSSKIEVADINGLLITVARTAPLMTAIICKLNDTFIETLSALKQRDAGVLGTAPEIPANFGLGQWYTQILGESYIPAASRLDQLEDVVEEENAPDGGVLTYSAADDKYYIREIEPVPVEDLDAGEF